MQINTLPIAEADSGVQLSSSFTLVLVWESPEMRVRLKNCRSAAFPGRHLLVRFQLLVPVDPTSFRACCEDKGLVYNVGR